MKRITKVISMLLVATLTFSTPEIAVQAKVNDRTMQLLQDQNTSQVKSGDLIYYGKKDDKLSFDTIWQVLDAKKTNTNEPGMFLMTKNLVAYQTKKGILFEDTDKPTGNEYRGSTIQKFCTSFAKKHLVGSENDSVIATTKSDTEFKTTFMGHTVPFVAAENILDHDKVFLLSAEEVHNTAYGFVDDTSRIATFNGVASNWWLRSPHDKSFPIDAGFVFANGSQADLYVNGFSMLHTPYTARLAMNLDTKQILFASAANETLSGKTGMNALKKINTKDVSKWKLTVKDASRSKFSASSSSMSSDTCSVSFSGAKTSEQEYISAIIVNNKGEITYYGNIAKGKESGLLQINLKGKYEIGDTLYVFSEHVSKGTSTNYASDLVEIK